MKQSSSKKSNPVCDFFKDFAQGLKCKKVHFLLLIIACVSALFSLIITTIIKIGASSVSTASLSDLPFVGVFFIFFPAMFVIFCWIEDMILFGTSSLGIYALFVVAIVILYFTAPFIILASPFDLVAKFRSFGQPHFGNPSKEEK